MPRKALTICAVPGCGAKVHKGRCEAHRRRPWDHRLSRHQRGYDAAWDRLRAQVIHEEPSCRYCDADSTTVDHMVPKWQGGTNDRANLCGCCRECQQRKAAYEGNEAKRQRGARR